MNNLMVCRKIAPEVVKHRSGSTEIIWSRTSQIESFRPDFAQFSISSKSKEKF